MSGTSLRWPSTMALSLLAALTTWLTLFAWRGLVEIPSGYLVPSFWLCLLVAVSGMLLRTARVPALLVVPAQLVLVGGWLCRRWAEDLMIGGWLPTPAALTEVGLRVNDGVLAAQQFAAPVPENATAIHALLVAGAAGTAVAVDFLACGLRRVPLAGLPLLAVYTVPVSIVSDGVAWWVFAASAVAFLSMMATDEAGRLVHWGRQMSEGGGRIFEPVSAPVSTQAVRTAARKIGFTATGLSVVLPIFIPTFGGSLFGGTGPGDDGSGDQVAISNPMVDLKRDLVRGDDVELVRVRTDEPNPSYLRISVLDAFDGETWKPSGRDIPVEQRARGRLPRAPGLEPDVDREEFDYRFSASEDFDSKWLPTPYPPTFVDVPGDWRYDLTTLDVISAADEQTVSGLEYDIQAYALDPTKQQLMNAAATSEEVFTPNTELPATTPALVRTLSDQVVGDATGKFEQAVALQDWFRRDGGFTYSTDREAGNGLNDLEQFLGDGPTSRVGYCEQFAAAMAVMGRALDIPSRVAVGFLRPEQIGERTYVYSAHDLHAWPEMYFEGVGWVRFEPTPQDRASGVPGYTRGGVPVDQPQSEPSADTPDRDLTRFDEQAGSAAPEGGGPQDPSGTGGGSTWSTVVTVLVLALLALVPGGLRVLVRRRRWAQATSPVATAEAAWQELRDSAVDLGHRWDDSVTLRTRARSLVSSFAALDGTTQPAAGRGSATGAEANPEATEALERLVKFVERARYARSVDAVADVADDVDLCVAALAAGASRAARLRARWLPASLVDDWRVGYRQARERSHPTAAAQPGVDHAV